MAVGKRWSLLEGRDIFITLSGRFVAIAYDDGSDFVVKEQMVIHQFRGRERNGSMAKEVLQRF